MKVPEITEQPEMQEFLSEYVSKRKPVVLDGMMRELAAETKFSGIDLGANVLADSGRAAISVVDVFHTKGSEEKERMSLSEYFRRFSKEGDLYTRGHLNGALKTRIGFPEMLRCSDVVYSALKDTQHVHFDHVFPFPIRSGHEDNMQ